MSKIPNSFYRTSIKALILDENKKVALCKQIINGNDYRDLPGGGLDHGENFKQCLKRELDEEAWLKVKTIADHPSHFITRQKIQDIYKNTPKREQYCANILYETILENTDFTTSDECQEFKFFSKEESKEINLFENVKKFFDQYNPSKH